MVRSGINDWGGISPVTVDFINPERAWPQIGLLRRATGACGYTLCERLTVYPRYTQPGSSYLAPRLAARIAALAREDGLAAIQYNS
jgi:FO synthase